MNVVVALLLAATVDAADMRAVCDTLEDESAREDCHQGVDLVEQPERDEPREFDWGEGGSDVERAEPPEFDWGKRESDVTRSEPPEFDLGEGESDVARAERKLAMRDMAKRIFERADKRARDAVAKTSLGKATNAAHAERFYECIGADTALLDRPLPIPQATGYGDLTDAELAALKPFALRWGYPWPPEEGKALTEAECDNLRRRGIMHRHEMCYRKNEWRWDSSKVCRDHARTAAEGRIASLVKELREEFIEEELDALAEGMSEPAIEEVHSEIERWCI